MSKVIKIPLTVAGIGAGLFVGTFTIYFFNLDMKAAALVEPLLAKWYDRRQVDFYL